MKKMADRLIASKAGWIILLLLIIVVNFLASIFHSRIDLTREKRYILSQATRNLLTQLDDKVQIDVFLKGDFPAGFRKLANSTEEFLRLMKDRNGTKVQYRFISPQDEIPNSGGRPWEDSLNKMGANAITLNVQVKAGEETKRVYPVALMTYQGKQALVDLYTGGKRMITAVEMNSAEAMMEYQFAKTLNGLIDTGRPMIAYSFGNGEPTDARTYGLQVALQNDYQLFTIDLNKQAVISDTFDVLMIVKPTQQFTEQEKLKIDQYLMRGGKLLLYIDALIAEQDSLRFKPETIAYDRNLNLTDLLFRYGVRINTSLLMDLQCDFLPFAVGGNSDNPQYEFLHWNYYPLFESRGNHTINRNLGLVAGRFVNPLDTIASPGIEKTVLLSSSPNSRIISTPALISLNENRNAPEDEKFKQDNIPAALLLEGSFTSLYRNRASQAQRDMLAELGMEFRDRSPASSKIIVVGDGDMAMNDVSPQQGPLPMGLNLFTAGSQYEYQFANREFLLNSLEYLVSNPAISETRNKDIVLRLLDTKKVEEGRIRWQMINIALPVLLVILAGFIYQFIRRRKYAD